MASGVSPDCTAYVLPPALGVLPDVGVVPGRGVACGVWPAPGVPEARVGVVFGDVVVPGRGVAFAGPVWRGNDSSCPAASRRASAMLLRRSTSAIHAAWSGAGHALRRRDGSKRIAGLDRIGGSTTRVAAAARRAARVRRPADRVRRGAEQDRLRQGRRRRRGRHGAGPPDGLRVGVEAVAVPTANEAARADEQSKD